MVRTSDQVEDTCIVQLLVNECILGKCNDLHNKYIVDRAR